MVTVVGRVWPLALCVTVQRSGQLSVHVRLVIAGLKHCWQLEYVLVACAGHQMILPAVRMCARPLVARCYGYD
jgi:hypothetical protein